MRLRSFSLAQVLPMEVIDLIIQQSSDSELDLYNWCLVSLSCLSRAGPSLNEHVRVNSERHFFSVMHRLVKIIPIPRGHTSNPMLRLPLASQLDLHSEHTRPLEPILPRLATALSLAHTRSITFDYRPTGVAVAALRETTNAPQPRRPHLTVRFAWQDKSGCKQDAFETFLAPTLIRMLRPSRLIEGTLVGIKHDERQSSGR